MTNAGLAVCALCVCVSVWPAHNEMATLASKRGVGAAAAVRKAGAVGAVGAVGAGGVGGGNLLQSAERALHVWRLLLWPVPEPESKSH